MTVDEKPMWEILVPTCTNENKPFRTRHHREWDRQVQEITGGLTIHPATKGKWIDPHTKKYYQDRCLPVRIACTKEQILQVMRRTIKHYDQLAVLAYKISDESLTMYADDI